jgi:hypothetical protein
MRSPEVSGLAGQVIFKRLCLERIGQGSGNGVASKDLKRSCLKRLGFVLKAPGLSRAENASELTAAFAAEVEGGQANRFRLHFCTCIRAGNHKLSGTRSFKR